MSKEVIGPYELKVSGSEKDKKLTRESKKETKLFLKEIGDFDNVYWDESFGKAILETKKIGTFRDKKEKIFKETGWKVEIRKPNSSGTVKKTRKLIFESQGRYNFLKETGRKIRRKRNSKKDWARISFLGGCKEVGRNAFLLQTPSSRILLDYGMKMENRASPFFAPELDLEKLDCILLTHSHLDHSGKIASLYSNNFNGPLYATEPSIALSRLLKKDSYKISKGNEDIGYEPADIDKMISHSIPIEYNKKTRISPDVKATFYNAGHLPGSCGVLLEINNRKKIFYTGDFDTRNSKLLYPAEFDLPNLNALIMESTYAYENIPSTKKVEKKLINVIEETIDDGGTPIVSTFAIGRAQEIISIIDEFETKADIYLDGMIREATKIVSAYPSYIKNELNTEINFVYEEKDREEAITKNNSIVLTTSGMLSGGAVEFYLEKLEKDKNSSLILPGYLAEGTPGRKIQNGKKEIEINGNNYDLDLKTFVLRFSGDSDHSDIWNFLHNVKGNPKTFVVHGEKESTEKLAKSIKSKMNWEAYSPRNLDSFRI